MSNQSETWRRRSASRANAFFRRRRRLAAAQICARRLRPATRAGARRERTRLVLRASSRFSPGRDGVRRRGCPDHLSVRDAPPREVPHRAHPPGGAGRADALRPVRGGEPPARAGPPEAVRLFGGRRARAHEPAEAAAAQGDQRGEDAGRGVHPRGRPPRGDERGKARGLGQRRRRRVRRRDRHRVLRRHRRAVVAERHAVAHSGRAERREQRDHLGGAVADKNARRRWNEPSTGARRRRARRRRAIVGRDFFGEASLRERFPGLRGPHRRDRGDRRRARRRPLRDRVQRRDRARLAPRRRRRARLRRRSRRASAKGRRRLRQAAKGVRKRRRRGTRARRRAREVVPGLRRRRGRRRRAARAARRRARARRPPGRRDLRRVGEP